MRILAETDAEIRARDQLYRHRVVEELYHTATDPDCLVNLIDDSQHTAALDSLRTSLQQIMVDTNDHCLEAFENREDPAAMEEYVIRKEQEATDRRAKERKKQPAKKTTQRKYKDLIDVRESAPSIEGRTITIPIDYQLPKDLDAQSLHVTLKHGKDRKRVERKVITITGSGTAQLTFVLPVRVSADQLHVAAFVGEDYSTNLQHVQIGPLKLVNRSN